VQKSTLASALASTSPSHLLNWVRVLTFAQNRSTLFRELFWEYLQWANAKVNEEFGVSFDIMSGLTLEKRIYSC